jgi:hypothetical protein
MAQILADELPHRADLGRAGSRELRYGAGTLRERASP